MVSTIEFRRDRNKRYYAKHPEKLDAQREWRGLHLEKNKETAKRYYLAHIEEIRALGRAYRASHKEERLAYQRAWRKLSPEKWAAKRARRRALKLQLTAGTIDYKAIMERDKMICGICHKRVAKKDLSFDHIVPLSCGGAHTEGNIQVAHRRCNSAKRDGRLPSQMRLPILFEVKG
mgnify:CR=1 FL=1